MEKVPVKLQKEVWQISKGSLQELFQKLLKAEEIIKERERSSNRSLETKEQKAISTVANLLFLLEATVMHSKTVRVIVSLRNKSPLLVQ